MPVARKKLKRFFWPSVSEDVDFPEDVERLRFSSTEGRADETALVLVLADFLDAAYAMASWSWGSEPSNSRRVILGASRPNILLLLFLRVLEEWFVVEVF